jgi:hypothetical protein
MRTVLVTGSPEAVEPVVAAVRAAGADGVGITADTDLVATLRELDPGSVSCYVQLPVGITPSGDTAVSRVHSFLEQGLLTRFRLVDAVLPALADDASVLLVGGHTQVEQQAPDDQSARRALLTVLAHAVRADRAPVATRVRVLDHHSHTAADIADLAVTGRGLSQEQRSARSAESVRAYEDWRTELFGMARAEV